jgi:hypothetical protein
VKVILWIKKKDKKWLRNVVRKNLNLSNYRVDNVIMIVSAKGIESVTKDHVKALV